MLRRNLKHMVRYPSHDADAIGMPVLFLLLFVYVFGGTMGAGLPGPRRRPRRLPDYITAGDPDDDGGGVSNGTAVSVAKDMTKGIIDRFRTMPIAKVSVLTGHVLGAMVQTCSRSRSSSRWRSLLGWRPQPRRRSGWAWPACSCCCRFAMTWLTVALGLASGSVRPRATRRCRSCCCRSSAAGSCRPSRCRPGCGGSPSTSRSRRSSRRSAACLAGSPGVRTCWWAIGWCVVIGRCGLPLVAAPLRTRAASSGDWSSC